MWSKWEERFKTFGAKRVQFETSRYGRKKSRVTSTGAKCLFFFDDKNSPQEKALKSIVEKILCNEVLEVTLLDEEDFGYQVKDKETNSYFGSRCGYQIFKFFPSKLEESKGKSKFRPSLIISRVFLLKKHQQRNEDGWRTTTYSFAESSEYVIAVHLKGALWGEVSPPDQEKPKLEDYFGNPRYCKNEERQYRCVYEYQDPSQVMRLINNFEAGTFTKWKRFRGIGFGKKYIRTSKNIYDVSVYTATKLLNYGNGVIKRVKEQGKRNEQHKMFYFQGIGICMKLRTARMLCYRAFVGGDSIEDRRVFTKSTDCSSVLDIAFWGVVNRSKMTIDSLTMEILFLDKELHNHSLDEFSISACDTYRRL